MKTILSFIMFSVFTSLLAQTTINLDFQKKTYLSIKGSSNVVSFSLYQNGTKFLKKNLTLTASQNQNKIYLSQNSLAIGVGNFTSENLFVLRDFRKMMQLEKYPHMHIQLLYIELLSELNQLNDLKGKAFVNITITGVTKQYVIPILTRKSGEIMLVKGSKKINITDFGLIPPEELMGLIKVNDWIDVDFQLNCKVSVQEPMVGMTCKD